MPSAKNFAQSGAVLVGIVYLGVGLISFAFTGFGHFVQDGTDTVLGFQVNPFHNVIHVAVGAYLLFIANFGRAATEGALIGGGLVYLLAAFLGAGNHLEFISINGFAAPDNFLHLVSGSAALGIGLASIAMNAASERRGEPA